MLTHYGNRPYHGQGVGMEGGDLRGWACIFGYNVLNIIILFNYKFNKLDVCMCQLYNSYKIILSRLFEIKQL